VALSDEIQTRLGQTELVKLTADDGGTTVNTTKLAAAIADAEGHFGLLVGLSPDITIASHLAAMYHGTIAYLHSYRQRSPEHTKSLFDRFEFFCKAARKIYSVSPQTNSKYTPSEESTGALPDMDPTGPLSNMSFSTRKRASVSELSQPRE